MGGLAHLCLCGHPVVTGFLELYLVSGQILALTEKGKLLMVTGILAGMAGPGLPAPFASLMEAEMVILGPAGQDGPDEKELRERAAREPRPEQVLDLELKRAFPMRTWGWQQRRRYVEHLDPVLYAHVMGKGRDV
jgi:hypothetical protein